MPVLKYLLISMMNAGQCPVAGTAGVCGTGWGRGGVNFKKLDFVSLKLGHRVKIHNFCLVRHVTAL